MSSRDRYGGSAVLAAALTDYTPGALAGAVLMIRWRPARTGWVALSGAALYTVVPLALAVPVPSLLLVAYAMAGFGVELFNLLWFTATQREVAPGLLARVSSSTSCSPTDWRPSALRCSPAHPCSPGVRDRRSHRGHDRLVPQELLCRVPLEALTESDDLGGVIGVHLARALGGRPRVGCRGRQVLVG